MKRIIAFASIAFTVTLLATQPSRAEPLSPTAGTCGQFSELHLTLEQNATDGDAEVVLFAKGQDEGLKTLGIFAPNYRLIAFFVGDQRGVGLREFLLESAEPPDLAKVLASFPQGNYIIVGRTMSGTCLRGTAALSHTPAPQSTLFTPFDEQVVPIHSVLLSWAGVAQAERYVVELNNETAGTEMSFEVLPPTTSIAIPPQFLQRGAEFQFVVGVKTANGNLTSVERTFFVAP